jgi:hypothetical protein
LSVGELAARGFSDPNRADAARQHSTDWQQGMGNKPR